MNERFELTDKMQPVENREMTDVEGGILDSCLPRLPLQIGVKPPIGFPLKDHFAKYHL